MASTKKWRVRMSDTGWKNQRSLRASQSEKYLFHLLIEKPTCMINPVWFDVLWEFLCPHSSIYKQLYVKIYQKQKKMENNFYQSCYQSPTFTRNFQTMEEKTEITLTAGYHRVNSREVDLFLDPDSDPGSSKPQSTSVKSQTVTKFNWPKAYYIGSLITASNTVSLLYR